VPRVIAIFGPTASGKSAVALALAERVGGEIVCADAMQAYAGLEILTNAPSAEERRRVPHHLLAIWRLSERGGVGAHSRLAHAAIDDVLARGRTPIVVGGTGLYLRAALGTLQLPPEPSAPLRAAVVARVDELGTAAAHELLRRRDQAAADRVHPRDRQRVVRALELLELGSSLAPDDPLAFWGGGMRHPTALAALRVPRPLLHRRIADRTRAMFERGVVAEVLEALAREAPSETAERALGLGVVAEVGRGRLDVDRAVELLTIRTRQYARRQETWLRRLPGRLDLDGTLGPDALAEELRRTIG
jgi:tRNA dimethylallyltransferase